METYRSEQEAFWAGTFGNEYVVRNNNDDLVAVNTALFAKILSHTSGVRSIVEFGANVGLNLRALKSLIPRATLTGVEINAQAAEKLRELGYINVLHQPMLDYAPDVAHDFALTKTVLIHIAPELLPAVYDKLFASASRYICMVEYYSQNPEEVRYRGHEGKLFKRDFAGEMLARFPQLTLLAYGFAYRHDRAFPMDDLSWFLLEKPAS